MTARSDKVRHLADADGIPDGDNAICWVLGSKFGKNRQPSFMLHTIAREIGHVFVGAGHPDDMNPGLRGEAPLPGTKHTCRLMCGGQNSGEKSRMLVKREWDEEEAWLETNIKDEEQ